MSQLGHLLGRCGRDLSRVIRRTLAGRDLDRLDCRRLLSAESPADRRALLAAADHLRRRQVGDDVGYVVNRNINFTNVCIKSCGFCAFSRTRRQQEGYLLPISEIVGRAQEAVRYGATEVCIQAGLPPDMPGDVYLRICRAVKEALPDVHVHAFSPEEILHACRLSDCGIGDYLKRLKKAGIGSLPGTSAEILVQEVRDKISPGRIRVTEWIEVITTAHALGIPTTSTIMYGHLETVDDCARHLLLLRDLQRRSGGFTEFVPLSFVAAEAPLAQRRRPEGLRDGAARHEVFNMHAAARLVLGRDIPNLQVSWVKEGLSRTGRLLSAGANDLGGTLINESISTSAGASHGQLARPCDLRALIRKSGRAPIERSTLYRTLRRFDSPEDDPIDPLDSLQRRHTDRFGSFEGLIGQEEFRFATTRSAQGWN